MMSADDFENDKNQCMNQVDFELESVKQNKNDKNNLHLSIGNDQSPKSETSIPPQDTVDTIFCDLKEIYSCALSPTIVYVATDTRNSNSKLKKDSLEQALQECQIQCQLDHFNTVQGYEYFENENEIAIILELLPEADYFYEKLENPPTPIKNELKIKSYLFDILQGLNYIHSLGYIHLDLKPANFYCFRYEDEEVRRVKVGDFGFSRKIDKDGFVHLKETCGTFGYKAPEVKKNSKVTQKSDIWSLGITLYVMAVAYMPHHMKGYKYGQGDIPFRDRDWKKRSPDLKNLIIKMLQFDPEKRPTSKQCLDDPYLTEVSITTPTPHLNKKMKAIREEIKQEDQE